MASALDIKKRLEQDTELPNRTTLSASNTIELLVFCLNNMYFLFQDQFFEQTNGAAMGLPVSQIVANIYMEAFEHRAITTALNPQKTWRRHADDTFVIQHQSHMEKFFKHINTVDPSIHFTVEEAGPDGYISFLDIIITHWTDGTFTTKVNRKPTHTDLYLKWDSHYNLASKYSVINTLTHMDRTMCSTPQLLISELKHLEGPNVVQVSQVGYKQSPPKTTRPPEKDNQ